MTGTRTIAQLASDRELWARWGRKEIDITDEHGLPIMDVNEYAPGRYRVRSGYHWSEADPRELVQITPRT